MEVLSVLLAAPRKTRILSNAMSNPETATDLCTGCEHRKHPSSRPTKFFQKVPFIFGLSLGLLFTALGQDPARSTVARSANFYYEHLVIPISTDIERDLQLTPQQAERWRRLRPPIRDTAGIQFAQDYIQRKKDVLQILNEEQRRRLQQLTLQYQGALASFLLPSVSASLGLSADQQEKLLSFKALLDSGSRNLSDYEKLLYGSDQSRGRFFGELRRSWDTIAESLLSAEQHLKWRGLQGPPLDPKPKSWGSR